MTHGADECHLTGLTLAQRVHPAILVAQLEPVDKLPLERGIPRREERAVQRKQIVDLCPRRQHLIFRHVSDAALHGHRVLRGRQAEHAYGAGMRMQHAHRKMQQRCLAGTIAAEQSDNLLALHRQRDAIQYRCGSAEPTNNVAPLE